MHPFYSPNSQLLSSGESAWIGFLSMALYLLFWAVVMAVVIRLIIKYLPHLAKPSAPQDHAFSILRERYARGELDEKTYRHMVAVLNDSAHEEPQDPPEDAAKDA